MSSATFAVESRVERNCFLTRECSDLTEMMTRNIFEKILEKELSSLAKNVTMVH